MPVQKPGRSIQDYATPREFLERVKLRWDFWCTGFHFDLAASAENTVAPRWYGSGGEAEDSLEAPWPLEGNLWLNPPFGNIRPWAAKCAAWGGRGRILFLTPASVGSNWFADYVIGRARVYFLQGRLSFDGTAPYPKDCMLSEYKLNVEIGDCEVWKWRA